MVRMGHVGVMGEWYLVGQIALLQSRVCTDALVDSPSKFIVQLPCLKCEHESSDSHQDRQSDQHGLNLVPEIGGDKFLLVEVVGCVLDLVKLYGGVDENADVV
jgi:hypothetical protein